MFTNPYTYGLITIILLYLFSIIFTGSFVPWALARGHNNKFSTSQLQFLIFTGIVVFAYTTVIAYRVINLAQPDKLTLPGIPVNLLVLMGFSISTVAGSKGITVSYLAQGNLTDSDESTATKNRDGSTDLVKVQMLMWTIIAAVYYLITFNRFMSGEGNLAVGGDNALPDIDNALLVLMGISQGGYLAGKLAARTGGLPGIANIIPSKVTAGESIVIQGAGFGDSKSGNDVIFVDSSGDEDLVPTDQMEWSDQRLVFSLPDKYLPSDSTIISYMVKVRANGYTTPGKEIKVYKENPKLDNNTVILEDLIGTTFREATSILVNQDKVVLRYPEDAKDDDIVGDVMPRKMSYKVPTPITLIRAE